MVPRSRCGQVYLHMYSEVLQRDDCCWLARISKQSRNIAADVGTTPFSSVLSDTFSNMSVSKVIHISVSLHEPRKESDLTFIGLTSRLYLFVFWRVALATRRITQFSAFSP